MQERARFHRLKLDHRFGLMRCARLFGLKIEDLPPDHAAQSGGARQSQYEFRANSGVVVGRGVRRHIKRISQKAITNKDRGRLAKGLVRGRPSPSQIVIVECRQIIMDERVTVDHFEGRRRTLDALAFNSEELRRLNREKWPEPLATAEARVAHGF